ncbi:PEGA domain-containing protein [Candidatus Saccharibacteria bacterium]|nr:PEGA domain-containing protein [Candidatus Saccharibacteria bacterium]
MDERERIQHLRRIKVIVTEIFMFISVICLVVFLTLVVTGYSFNLKKLGGQGEVIERTGLIQISSLPTGATITIDGGIPLLLRTNASRALGVGEHEILLSREGYGEWKKTVSLKEGMMYRVNYPRLFLEEREAEKVTTLEGLSATSVAPNMEKMIALANGKFYLYSLNETKSTIEALEVLNGDKVVEKIESFEEIEWGGNSERLLAKINGKYGVLSVKKTAEVVFLDEIWKELKVSKVRLESEAGDKLIVLDEAGELREIDLKSKKISEVLLKGVLGFDNDGEDVVYIRKRSDEEMKAKAEDEEETEKSRYTLEAYQIGAEESYLIAELSDEKPKISTMKYFNDNLCAVVSGGKIEVYASEEWPGEDFEMEKVFEGEIGFEAKELLKRGKGMAFSIRGVNGEELVYDVEAEKMIKVELSTTNGWVDEFLRFELGEEGEMSVVDYDGLNKRKLVEKGVNGKQKIVVSGNNKWLYYFKGETLTRERII